MSRCISCNKVFKPSLIYDHDDKFIGFEDMCSECINMSTYEGSYLDDYEDGCIKAYSDSINYDNFSVKVLTD